MTRKTLITCLQYVASKVGPKDLIASAVVKTAIEEIERLTEEVYFLRQSIASIKRMPGNTRPMNRFIDGVLERRLVTRQEIFPCFASETAPIVLIKSVSVPTAIAA